MIGNLILYRVFHNWIISIAKDQDIRVMAKPQSIHRIQKSYYKKEWFLKYTNTISKYIFCLFDFYHSLLCLLEYNPACIRLSKWVGFYKDCLILFHLYFLRRVVLVSSRGKALFKSRVKLKHLL